MTPGRGVAGLTVTGSDQLCGCSVKFFGLFLYQVLGPIYPFALAKALVTFRWLHHGYAFTWVIGLCPSMRRHPPPQCHGGGLGVNSCAGSSRQ